MDKGKEKEGKNGKDKPRRVQRESEERIKRHT